MSELDQNTIDRILEVIRQHRKFLVATHVHPDGDAIGALLGLTCLLHKLGKTADPYCCDPPPPSHLFLPGVEQIRYSAPDPSDYEVAVLVDCGELHRVGPALAEVVPSVPFLINIDHHINDRPFGDISWVRSSASSTCEMLFDLCTRIPGALDEQIATQLYLGIVTDTGSFRFANTTHRVLEIAALLVAAVAQPAYVAEQVFDSASPQRLQLLARALSTVFFYSDNRLATAALTRDMYAQTGTSQIDSEGFINHLRSVRTVELAMLFREDPDGTVHVSLRSKGKVDVAAFAHRYGGGGHRHAAAFRTSGKIDSVRALLTAEAASYLP